MNPKDMSPGQLGMAGLATLGALGLVGLGIWEFNTPECNKCNTDLAVCQKELEYKDKEIKRLTELVEAKGEEIGALEAAKNACKAALVGGSP